MEGVVQEQIDVVIRRNMHLIVIGAIVVVVAANALLNNPKVETAAVIRLGVLLAYMMECWSH